MDIKKFAKDVNTLRVELEDHGVIDKDLVHKIISDYVRCYLELEMFKSDTEDVAEAVWNTTND